MPALFLFEHDLLQVFCKLIFHISCNEYSVFFYISQPLIHYTKSLYIKKHFAHIFNLEYTDEMRLLGIDYGTKHIGIALSDEGGQFAMPLNVLSSSKNLLQEVLEIIKENKAEEIVMGESRDYKGKANAVLAKSLEFKKQMEAEGLKVHLEPEFMTSENAERLQGKHDMLDASSAALILQSFLDKRNIKG